MLDKMTHMGAGLASKTIIRLEGVSTGPCAISPAEEGKRLGIEMLQSVTST